MSTEEPESNKPQEEEQDEAYVEEEVTTVEGWAPSVTLEVKEEVNTGEEEEETLYSQRSRLYRWATSEDGPGEWKERGTGDCKIMKHKKTNKVRFLMRQEKTGKIVGNHYIVENEASRYYELKPNAGSDKCWVWMAQDFSEDQVSIEQLALKFGTPEKANEFQKHFNEAKELNKLAFKKPE
jgi:Ran-binding protein 1